MFFATSKFERATVTLILILAAILRALAAALIPDQSSLLPDANSYRNSATELLQHWHLTFPYEMPLYPILIAIFGHGIGQISADISLSVISVWLVYALTNELFANKYAAIFASAAAACYPPLIFFSVVGLSETLFITLILASFLLWYRMQFTAAAIFAVLAILTRPIFDLFAPLMVIVSALVVHRLSWKATLPKLAVYAVIYCMLMMPWWLNNFEVYGTFVRLTPGAGTVLYAGNNPMNHSGGGNVGIDYDLGAFQGIADPVQRDNAIKKAAFAYIIENPRRFLELAGLKFMRMWRPWPANEGYKSLSTILVAVFSFVPILLLALGGLFLTRKIVRRTAPILLFSIGYTAVHLILPATIRYRLPLEPFLLIFAGVTCSYLVDPKLFKLTLVRDEERNVCVREAGSPQIFSDSRGREGETHSHDR